MTMEIQIQSLVKFETAVTDGTAVNFIVTDIDNGEIGIILSIETLTALLVALPAMASSAVKRTHDGRGICGSRIRYREFRSNSVLAATCAF